MFEGRAIGRGTYKMFAKRYGIKLSTVKNGVRKLKTLKQLSEEIFKFETDNYVDEGLYYF